MYYILLADMGRECDSELLVQMRFLRRNRNMWKIKSKLKKGLDSKSRYQDAIYSLYPDQNAFIHFMLYNRK